LCRQASTTRNRNTTKPSPNKMTIPGLLSHNDWTFLAISDKSMPEQFTPAKTKGELD